MSLKTSDVRAEGTLVKETTKTYWFPAGKFVGQVITTARVMTMFKDLAGRKLTGFETGLVLAVPRSGTASVMVLTTLVIDSSQRVNLEYLKSMKRDVLGYILRIRESGRHHNYGDVIGTDAVYTPDGERLGEVTIYRKQEPPLEKPFLDPIDLLGGVLASSVKSAGSKLLGWITKRRGPGVGGGSGAGAAGGSASGAAGSGEAIANPTLEQVKALVPQGHDLQSWGRLIWGTGANGATAMKGTRTAAQLRQIPGLNVNSATTLRNFLFNLPTGAGGVAPTGRVELLDEIIQKLGGMP